VVVEVVEDGGLLAVQHTVVLLAQQERQLRLTLKQ
jgi:hypothetical protein